MFRAMKDRVLKRSANLARVTLSKKDVEEFLPEMESLLEWEREIEKLLKQQNDTPSLRAIQEKLFTFSYEEESCCDDILSYVKTEHGYFVVPKVIE